MGYTKRQIADLILARVGGGLPSDDLSVRFPEVIKLIPAAINYNTVADYRIERRINRNDWNSSDKTADLSQFVGTYTIEVSKDKDRELSYIPIEQGLMDLPGNRAIEAIFPKGSNAAMFAPIRSHAELIGVPPVVLGGTTFYWTEMVNGQDRVYFSNVSHVVKEVIARVAVDMNQLDMDEDIPAPDHTIMAAMDLLASWFTGQRQMPEELVNNNRDDKLR